MKHSTRIALYLGSYAGVFIGTGVFIVGAGIWIVGLSFAGCAVGCWRQELGEERKCTKHA